MNYFKLPNSVTDELMQTLRPTEFVVLMCVVRKTIGWHKATDAVSLSQIQKMTGIKTRKTVIRALNGLTRRGIIKATKKRRCTTIYELLSLSANPSVKITLPSVKTTHQLGEKIHHVPSVKNTHTKDIIKNSKERKNLSGVKIKETNKENGLTAEVKDSLALDNQGLKEAAELAGIEIEAGETSEDFRIRLLSSITRGAFHAMQS